MTYNIHDLKALCERKVRAYAEIPDNHLSIEGDMMLKEYRAVLQALETAITAKELYEIICAPENEVPDYAPKQGVMVFRRCIKRLAEQEADALKAAAELDD